MFSEISSFEKFFIITFDERASSLEKEYHATVSRKSVFRSHVILEQSDAARPVSPWEINSIGDVFHKTLKHPMAPCTTSTM